jgi:hypothetical protein
MSINYSKVLLSLGLGLSFSEHGEHEFADRRVSKGKRRGNPKFKYAGLSKHAPSHAQQKRDSKKAKNKVKGK